MPNSPHVAHERAPIVFTGGGTGGHVFPVLAIIEELRSGAAVVWLGSKTGMEAGIVAERGIEFIGISAGKLRRYVSLRNIADFFRFLAGILQALVQLARIRPRLLFSKGGYVSVAPVIAARLLKIPVISHESDYDPGMATRINLRFSSVQCIPFEESRRFYPSEQTLLVSGNPIRMEITRGKRARGLQHSGLKAELPVLVVMGGSLGSRQINTLIKQNISQLLEHTQIIHQTGDSAWDIDIPEYMKCRYYAQDFFTSTYSDILATADVVLARSGAGLLWEVGVLAKPAVFIPLSVGTRGDQIRNARYAERSGAAMVCVSEGELDSLADVLVELIRDSDRRQSMSSAWAGIVHGEGAARIARLIDNYMEHGMVENIITKEAEK